MPERISNHWQDNVDYNYIIRPNRVEKNILPPYPPLPEGYFLYLYNLPPTVTETTIVDFVESASDSYTPASMNFYDCIIVENTRYAYVRFAGMKPIKQIINHQLIIDDRNVEISYAEQQAPQPYIPLLWSLHKNNENVSEYVKNEPIRITYC